MSSLLPDYTAAAFLLSISAVVSLWALIWNSRSLLSKLPYPPGPDPVSAISGNRNQITSTPNVWRKYKEWAEKYGNVDHYTKIIFYDELFWVLGDIIYLRSYRQPIIIINSFKDAEELLEKRSRIYSSRPITPMYRLYVVDHALLKYLIRSPHES